MTRDDKPGCDDAARHHGTVLRLVARDTVVATRIASDLHAARQRALVVVGDHDYGHQLDDQLPLAALPHAEHAEDADLVVLAGLAGQPEIERAAATAPLALIAFDGAQGAALGDREVRLALPTSSVFDTFIAPRRRLAVRVDPALTLVSNSIDGLSPIKRVLACPLTPIRT